MREEDVGHQVTVLFPVELGKFINIGTIKKRYFSGINDINFKVTAHLICMIYGQ